MSVAATVRPAGGVFGDAWDFLTGGVATDLIPLPPELETPTEQDDDAWHLLWNCFPDGADAWDRPRKIAWARQRSNEATWYWASWGEKECGAWLVTYGGSGALTGIQEGFSGTSQERADIEAAFHLANVEELEAGGEFADDARAALDALAADQSQRAGDPWYRLYARGASIGQTVRRVYDDVADKLESWWPYVKWGGLAAVGVFLVYLVRPFFVAGAKLASSR